MYQPGWQSLYFRVYGGAANLSASVAETAGLTANVAEACNERIFVATVARNCQSRSQFFGFEGDFRYLNGRFSATHSNVVIQLPRFAVWQRLVCVPS